MYITGVIKNYGIHLIYLPVFIHDCFTVNESTVWLSQYQWSRPDENEQNLTVHNRDVKQKKPQHVLP